MCVITVLNQCITIPVSQLSTWFWFSFSAISAEWRGCEWNYIETMPKFRRIYGIIWLVLRQQTVSLVCAGHPTSPATYIRLVRGCSSLL